MPPGDAPPAEDQAPLEELRGLLASISVQALRQAARRWGWPLRGTAKADIVEQLIERLTDPAQMQRVVQSLPLDAREVLAWLAVLEQDRSAVRRIEAAVNAGSGRTLDTGAINGILADLAAGCLVFNRGYLGYQTPALYHLWLPRVEAARLRRDAAPTASRVMTRTDLLQAADVLLTAVEVEQPIVQPPPSLPSRGAAGQRQETISPAPGLLAPELLIRWGFGQPTEQHLAHFLVEQLINSGLVQAEQAGRQGLRLKPAELKASWDQADAAARLGHLRGAALGMALSPTRLLGSWTELSLALPAIERFTLRALSYYGSMSSSQVAVSVNALRAQVVDLLLGLTPDTWYDLDRLDMLFYHVLRDPLNAAQRQGGGYLRWYQATSALDPQQMPVQTWRQTYGQLLRAVLAGPAYWLQLVELGYDGSRWVAVRVPPTEVVGEARPAPPDALGFAENEFLLIRTSRWMGELRRLALLIAREAAQRPDVRVFRLSPAALRATLRRGLSVADVAGQFAAAGFSLPPAMVQQLQTWQARAGRHHLYDNLAVIELGEDVLLAEIQAIAHLLGVPTYQASPRCLLVLEPAAVPTLADELVRRGYTPKVLP